MFWASVVGSVACKRVLWNTTVIFTTNKYIKIPTMILFSYLNQFYKTEQGVGSSPNRNSCIVLHCKCIVSSRLNTLLLCSHRTNKTCLRDELLAICKLQIEGRNTWWTNCEDDLMLSTRVESISSIKFFNYLQLGDAVLYYQTYWGITRRSRHTDAYQYAQEEEIRYRHTEVFFTVVRFFDSVMTCGAALAQMPEREKHFANTVPCNTMLSSQSHCSHFQTKRAIFYIVCLRLIVMTEMLPHAWDTRLFLFAS